MTAKPKPIPVPMAVRWRRSRERMLPALAFGVAAVGAALLWTRQPIQADVVAEAELVSVQLQAGADGVLTDLPGGPLSTFDRVRAGHFVAQLDDSASLAQHATLLAELEQLRAELTAAERTLAIESASFDTDIETLAHRRAVDIEQHRLESVELRARVQRDEIRLQRAEVLYQAALEAYEASAETKLIVDELGLRRDEIDAGLAGYRARLAETEAQLAKAQERLASSPSSDAYDHADELLAPIRAAIGVQDARIREIEIAAIALTIRSPIDGVVQQVHSRPGQPVRAGDPIVTITSESAGHLVAYLRELHGVRPSVGLQADVVLRDGSQQRFTTLVDSIGAAYVPVPPHHLRDPNLPEWGMPVRLLIPADVTLTPGSLVDVRFRPSS